MSNLLSQGLVITAIGIGMVFAALGLLWGLLAVLPRLFRSEEPDEGAVKLPAAAESTAPAASSPGDELSTERARVAAIVASALRANALPPELEVPVGPIFEHGRTAPIWVSANRARALQSWQPPRSTEQSALE